jgi:hypothetical protein
VTRRPLITERPKDGAYDLVDPDSPSRVLTSIKFQRGSWDTSGLNGVTVRDLFDVCWRELEKYREGHIKCRENELILETLKTASDALAWWESRERREAGRRTGGSAPGPDPELARELELSLDLETRLAGEEKSRKKGKKKPGKPG